MSCARCLSVCHRSVTFQNNNMLLNCVKKFAWSTQYNGNANGLVMSLRKTSSLSFQKFVLEQPSLNRRTLNKTSPLFSNNNLPYFSSTHSNSKPNSSLSKFKKHYHKPTSFYNRLLSPFDSQYRHCNAVTMQSSSCTFLSQCKPLYGIRFHSASSDTESHHKKESKKSINTENFKRENLLTIPNVLTVSRIVSAPILSYMVLIGSYHYGLGLFLVAGITDLLDGFIARRYVSQKTVAGTVLDPLADKLLVSILMISLTSVSLIPAWLTCIIVSRDLGLIGWAFYVRYITMTPPKTLSRYFDITKPSAKVYPSNLSKANTALQLSLVAFTLAAPVFEFVDHPLLHGLWYITAVTTISSLLGYMRKGVLSHVKVIKNT